MLMGRWADDRFRQVQLLQLIQADESTHKTPELIHFQATTRRFGRAAHDLARNGRNGSRFQTWAAIWSRVIEHHWAFPPIPA
jgi:hypothetical protein